MPAATRAGALIAAALGVLAGLAVVLGAGLGGVEQDTVAARFGIRGVQHPRNVVVVGIDEHSFTALRHRWPFPRSWHGTVLGQLRRAGARAVFYDVQFTEPTTPSQDGALYTALGDTAGAILATTATDGHGHTDVLGGDANLAAVHSHAAFSDFPVGSGGVIARTPFAMGGLVTPAVAIAERVTGRAPRRSLFAGSGALIDYPGPPGTVPALSFADVLRGHFDPAAVRGKIVVVGATAPSLQDMHATPAAGSALMSGPEVQADAIATVLDGVPLRPLPLVLAIALIVVVAIPGPLLRLRRPVSAVVLAGLAMAAMLLAGGQLAFDAGVVIPIVGPLLAIATATVATLVSSHLIVTRELRATQMEIVDRLGRAAESRDGETGRHLDRMAFMCERLALAAGLRRAEARLIRHASALHDVGKIAVPDAVLKKTGRFDGRDRVVMETHAEAGAEMLGGSTTSLVQVAEQMAQTHHERWDGTGYPAGLRGEEIPLAGRICAICDVFDALISRRRYKVGWSLTDTLVELERGGGGHFDPRLLARFMTIAPRLYYELTSTVDPDLTVGEHQYANGGPVGDDTEPIPGDDAVDAEPVPALPV